MSALTVDLISNKRILLTIIAFLFGITGGGIIIYFSKLPPFYLFMLEFLMLMSFVLLFFKKVKPFLVAILILTITINIDKTLYFIPAHTGGVSGVVVAAWLIILIGLYVIWGIELYQGTADPVKFFPQLTIPFLMVIILSLFSMVKAVNVPLSIFQLIQMIKVFLLFFYIANNIKTSRDYQIIFIFLIVGFVGELILAYYQHIMNDYVDLGIFSDAKPHRARQIGEREIMAVYGTTSGSHRFASYLIMILPILLSVILSRIKFEWKAIYGLIFVNGLVILIYTFSRGGWVGFAVGISILFFLKLYKPVDRIPRYLQLFLLLIIVVFIIFYFKEEIFLRITGEDYGSAYSRIPMMQIAFEIIKANPILGIGLNNYTIVMSSYDTTGITYEYFQPVHNAYLQLAAEIGIGGLLFFLIFLVMLYRTGIQTLRQADEFHREHLIGIICGITALLVHQSMNNGNIDSEPFELFWIFVGLIAAFSLNSQKSSKCS